MLNIGDRVLARWPVDVDWWYPGVVVGAGRRVYGRFEGGTYSFPGVVAACTGAAIHILYDDGDADWTSVGMVRVHRDDVPAP